MASVQRCHLSLAGALHGALLPLGIELDLTDLLGRSGLAFRMAFEPPISADTLELLADSELAERVALLGTDFRRVLCHTTAPDLPARLRLANELVRQALSRGLAPIVFGLDGTPTYGLIAGLAPDGRWLGSTQAAPAPAPLPERCLDLTSRLDVLIVEPGPLPDTERALWAGLASMYPHDWQQRNIVYDAAAYSAWGEAMQRSPDDDQHLAIATILAEVTAHGAAYLRRLAEHMPAVLALKRAATLYRQIAALLVELRQLLESNPQRGVAEHTRARELVRELGVAEQEAQRELDASLRAVGFY